MEQFKQLFTLLINNLHQAGTLLQGILQEYFLMELDKNFPNNSWKPVFLEYIEDESRRGYADKYNAALQIIREKGMDNYSVFDMDVTLIVSILKGRGQFECCRETSIRNQLDSLREDRNAEKHNTFENTFNQYMLSAEKNLSMDILEKCSTLADEVQSLTDGIIKDSKRFLERIKNLPIKDNIADSEVRNELYERYLTKLNRCKDEKSNAHRALNFGIFRLGQQISAANNPETNSGNHSVDASISTDTETKDSSQATPSLEQTAINDSNGGSDSKGMSVETSFERTIRIERDLFAKHAKSNDRTVLKAVVEGVSENTLQYKWGFLTYNGSFFQLSKSSTFSCTYDKSLGKTFRCVVTGDELATPLIGEYGPVTEEDFQIPILGNASINMEICTKDVHKNEIVLKARFAQNNIDGKPCYTWRISDQQICTQQDSRLPVNETMLNQTVTCEISHPYRTGAVPAEYVVDETEYMKLKTELNAALNPLPKSTTEADCISETDAVTTDTNDISSDSAMTTERRGTVIGDSDTEHIPSQGLSPETESEPTPESAPVPSPEPTQEPAPVSTPKLKPEPTPAPPSPQVSFAVENPTVVTAPPFRCFDSNDSRLHYFIAPRNTYYCTNAYEYLDYNEFLYRLLKEQGYERVIIVSNFSEDEGDNYPVLTYDLFSHRSFLKFVDYQTTFEDAPAVDAAAQKAFCDKYATAPSATTKADQIRGITGGRNRAAASVGCSFPRYGKQVIMTLVKPSTASAVSSDSSDKKPVEIFENFIISEVNAAMKSNILKTAIVLPLEVFEQQGWLSDLVIRRLDEMISKRSKNVIIITADQKEDFFSLFNGELPNRYKGFDNEFAKAIASIQGAKEPQACCDAFVNALEEKSRILIASEKPQTDEIANLLFMMKIRQPKRFDRLPYSKVYSLAEYIFEKCGSKEQTQKAFPDLSRNTWCVDSLESLYWEMDNDDTAEALIRVAVGLPNHLKPLWDKNINVVNKLKATSIERISGTSEVFVDKKTHKRYFGIPMARFSTTEAERREMIESAQADLKQMIGLSHVKTKIKELTEASVRASMRKRTAPEPGNYIFEGNPGTGKTEVARLMGKMLHAAGLLRRGHTVEVSASDLIGQYIGETSIKTKKKCEEALDGVLFIDEAYQLVNTDRSLDGQHTNSYAMDAYTTLLKFMEDQRSRICVIAAGYPNKMNAFRSANEGMASRIPDSNIIRFDDYSMDELIQILEYLAKRKGYVSLSKEFIEEAKRTLEEMKIEKGDRFGNGRDVRSLLEESILKAEIRQPYSDTITLTREDIEANRNVRDPEAAERAWAALDRYVGLKNLKSQLKEVVEYQRAFGIIKVDSMIFAGPPGTGKSEVASKVAPILRAEGILKTDTFVPAPLENLIGRTNGDTESKTKALCEAALDGVLFVDEAYGMINPLDSSFKTSYHEAAYTTIMRYMTEHKNHMVVIFAGYADMMDAFVKANPGMSRRIKVINFEPYSDDELYEIFLRKANEYAKTGKRIHLAFSDEFAQSLKHGFSVLRLRKADSFGNAGEIEDLLTKCSLNAAKRLGMDLERESTITLEASDIPEELQGNTKDDEGFRPTYRLIDRDEIENATDPYLGIDIHGEDFAAFCIQSIPRIENKFGHASAFVISPKGYAVTCAHAVTSKEDFRHVAATDLIARFTHADGSKEKYPYEIINIRSDVDMALIRIKADHDLPYLKLAPESRQIKFGEDCHLCGYPDGREGILLQKGSINSLPEEGKDGELGSIYFFDGDAFPGDSGGPIIAKSDGCVIGILRGARGPKDGSMHNYMKPICYFWKEFLI